MIRLSRMADYSVLLMAGCARSDVVLVSAQNLAMSTRVPPATVSKLLKKLLKSGLLVSVQGMKGGYRLARSASEITVADIITAVDGPIGLTLCSSSEGDCALEQLCFVRLGFKRINDVILQELAKVTLAEIAHPNLMGVATKGVQLNGQNG